MTNIEVHMNNTKEIYMVRTFNKQLQMDTIYQLQFKIITNSYLFLKDTILKMNKEELFKYTQQMSH